MGDVSSGPFGVGAAERWSRSPSALSVDEEASPSVHRLARRFNPAMAITDPDLWPVEVRYAWADGANLVAETLDRAGRVLRTVAMPNADLDRRSWADLPARAPNGSRVRYTMDLPGDDRRERGSTRWRHRFRALAGTGAAGQTPTSSAFPPTQYAHLFWYDRAQGLLGIQYWFFYPFNEWVNRHEGDWEHINIILKGEGRLDEFTEATFRPVGYQFFFHGWRYDTQDVFRIAGDSHSLGEAALGSPDDHVVVFAGGQGRLFGWGGTHSGASYPLPARFRDAGSGPLKPTEDTRAPTRFLAARDFQVIVLPEPDRLDANLRPELSWVRLDFFAGQAHVAHNPPFVSWLGKDGPVAQPARRAAWNARGSKPLWRGRPEIAEGNDLGWPAEWKLIAAPAATASMLRGLLPAARASNPWLGAL